MKLCKGPKKINLQTDERNEFGGRIRIREWREQIARFRMDLFPRPARGKSEKSRSMSMSRRDPGNYSSSDRDDHSKSYESHRAEQRRSGPSDKKPTMTNELRKTSLCGRVYGASYS